jgi:hypothetical protein
MMLRFHPVFPMFAALVGTAGSLAGQLAAPKVTISSVIDTSSRDAAAIVRLVRAYLSSANQVPTSADLWAKDNALDRRAGDINRFYVYQGYPATVVTVMPAAVGDSLYLVKVLHASAEDSAQRIEPWALQRLYAVRAPGASFGWQLSNALPRETRNWATHSVGSLTFYYAPGQRPSHNRATAAARFADSVARLFAVALPNRLHYYVTASPEEYSRALGLDFLMLPSSARTGGQAIPEAGVVVAGDPSLGEAYLHEIAHAVLGRGFGGAVLAEGIPTWLAGSRGRSPRQMYQLLEEYQRVHPQTTLSALLGIDGFFEAADNDARYATGALFVEALYRQEGVAALRSLATTPGDPQAFIEAMRTRLRLAAGDAVALDRWWRDMAQAFARGR